MPPRPHSGTCSSSSGGPPLWPRALRSIVVAIAHWPGSAIEDDGVADLPPGRIAEHERLASASCRQSPCARRKVSPPTSISSAPSSTHTCCSTRAGACCRRRRCGGAEIPPRRCRPTVPPAARPRGAGSVSPDRARSAAPRGARAGCGRSGLGKQRRQRDAEPAADLVHQLRGRAQFAALDPRQHRAADVGALGKRRRASGPFRRATRGCARRSAGRYRWRSISYRHHTIPIYWNQARLVGNAAAAAGTCSRQMRVAIAGPSRQIRVAEGDGHGN